MVDLNRAGRIGDKELRSQLDRMEIQDLVRSGNLYEIRAKLPLNISARDFDDFMRHQGARLHELFQNVEIKSEYAASRSPDISRFPVQHQDTSIPREDMTYFNQEMGSALGGAKFQTIGGSKGLGGGKLGADGGGQAQAADQKKLSPEELSQMSPDEIAQMSEGTLSDFQQFMDETWMQILDAQMMQDYQSKMGELQAEVRRIVALVKQGVLGPEFALIALAKVNATKNGVLLTGLGKKAYHVNESINRIATDLKKSGASDIGTMSVAQAKTRDGAFQLNLLTTDMQKLMQDSASVLEQVHGIMGEMNRTRREIITKVAAH